MVGDAGTLVRSVVGCGVWCQCPDSASTCSVSSSLSFGEAVEIDVAIAQAAK